MFKKNQKDNGTFLKENANKSREFYLSTLISAQNLRRWNTVKDALCFQTNEEFVTKLLDIAEEYLHG